MDVNTKDKETSFSMFITILQKLQTEKNFQVFSETDF
jgi:hypothetical protein